MSQKCVFERGPVHDYINPNERLRAVTLYRVFLSEPGRVGTPQLLSIWT